MRLSALFFTAFAALAFFAALLSLPAPAQQQQSAPPRFVETFTAIDEARWVVADGWSNGAWTANDWRREQIARIDDGIEITLARAEDGDKQFTSGELQSHVFYQYGYFETRLRAPRGSGLVTGFFTYVREGGTRSWDEIDIEILGRNTRAVQFTTFNNGRRRITTKALPFDAAEDFHTYGFEWTPRHIRWYVDGVLMHEERAFFIFRRLPQDPQRLYLHLWNSETLTDWLGPIRPEQAPWRLRVSCIAYAERYEGRELCAPPL